MNRLNVKTFKEPAIKVHRVSVKAERLVYVIVVPRKQRYIHWNKKSRIVYIGTTKNGISRVASSMASRADDTLSLHGVKTFEIKLVTCNKRKNVQTWKKLESVLLLSFREKYGELPLLNSKADGINAPDLFYLFSRDRIRKILEELER